MTSIIQHPTLGTIVYEEGFWTGKKKLSINGKPLTKENKKTFLYSDGEESKVVYLKGNFVSGTKLYIDNEIIEIVPAAKWYEIACSVFIFVLNMIWGNSVALCSIIPIVGGAIGGGISGALALLNVVAMKSVKNVALKLAIWLVMTLAMLVICCLLAFLLVPLFV